MGKKHYIQPTLNVFKVALGALLEASNTVPTYNPNESFSDESSVGVRRNNSLWDDEEEE